MKSKKTWTCPYRQTWPTAYSATADTEKCSSFQQHVNLAQYRDYMCSFFDNNRGNLPSSHEQHHASAASSVDGIAPMNVSTSVTSTDSVAAVATSTSAASNSSSSSSTSSACECNFEFTGHEDLIIHMATAHGCSEYGDEIEMHKFSSVGDAMRFMEDRNKPFGVYDDERLPCGAVFREKASSKVDKSSSTNKKYALTFQCNRHGPPNRETEKAKQRRVARRSATKPQAGPMKTIQKDSM